jgi:hypothetical protein
MTNTEVEDVLSSIRRLVSDDKRAEAAPKPTPAADRLVLTPSLRVMQDDADQDAADQDDADQDGADQDGADQDGADQDVAIHEDKPGQAAVLTDVVGKNAAQGDEVAPVNDADAPDDTPADDTPANDSNDDTLVLDLPLHADAPAADAQEAALEYDSSAADAKSNASDDGDAGTGWPWAKDAEDAAQADTPMAGETDEDRDPVATSPETLSAKIAALETLIAARKDEWEPDSAGTDANAGTEPPAMAWEDAADDDLDPDLDEDPANNPFDEAAPAAAHAPRNAASGTQTARETEIFSSDEDVLDEEALRELVSDIVREELQGALGERITRNVRKLVRREIHRAMAAQDLE